MPTLADLLAQAQNSPPQEARGLQGSLADLLRPATVNPLMAQKLSSQAQAYPRADPMANYPADWQQFGANMAQQFPTPATGGTPAQMDAAAMTLAKSIGPGMMIGARAKTWNPQLAKIAQDMERAGKTDREIWHATGNWRGPDGALRQEIPDNLASLKDGFGNSTLGSLVNHPDAFAAYPKLGATPAEIVYGAERGSFNPITGAIRTSGPTNQDRLSTTLHEIQHSIQQREGWGRGGSPAGMQDSVYRVRDSEPSLSAYEQYRRLAGEAEARMTQSRMNMTTPQRRATFPEDSYDVPLSQLIVRK